jgi:signal transduction histidine kinase
LENDMQPPQKQQQSRDSFFAELSAAAQAKAKAEAEHNAGNGAGGGAGGGSRGTGLGNTGLDGGGLGGGGRSSAGQAAQPTSLPSLPPLPEWPADGRRERGRGIDVSGIQVSGIQVSDAWPQEMHYLQDIRDDIRDLGGLREIQDILAPSAAPAAQTAQNPRVAHVTDRRTARRRAGDAEDAKDEINAPAAAAPWIRPDWMTRERSPLDQSAPPPPLPMRGTGEHAAAAAESSGGAGLAHDASNLLAALMLYSELLAMPGVLAEGHRHYADDLNLLAERCQRLIDRLVSFGGAVDREREQPSTRARVSLVDVLMRCEGLLSTLARRSLQITFGAQAALPVAIAPEPLERILVNLVKNATQATRQGGAVRLGVGLSAEPETGETAARPRSPRREAGQGGGLTISLPTMVLTVDDSGCGMTEAQIERVLQPAAPVADGRRQGIGLRVVRELVTASCGQLRIFSLVGVGTRVEIRWPVSSGEAASPGEQPASGTLLGSAGTAPARAAIPGRIARMEMVADQGTAPTPHLAAEPHPGQNGRPGRGPSSGPGFDADSGWNSARTFKTDSRLASVPAVGKLTEAERRLLESHGRTGKGAVSCSPGFHQNRKGAIAC